MAGRLSSPLFPVLAIRIFRKTPRTLPTHKSGVAFCLSGIPICSNFPARAHQQCDKAPGDTLAQRWRSVYAQLRGVNDVRQKLRVLRRPRRSRTISRRYGIAARIRLRGPL